MWKVKKLELCATLQLWVSFLWKLSIDSASVPSPTLICFCSVFSSSSERWDRSRWSRPWLVGIKSDASGSCFSPCCFPSGLMWISSSSSLVSKALGCSRARQMFRSRSAHCWSETNIMLFTVMAVWGSTEGASVLWPLSAGSRCEESEVALMSTTPHKLVLIASLMNKYGGVLKMVGTAVCFSLLRPCWWEHNTILS